MTIEQIRAYMGTEVVDRILQSRSTGTDSGVTGSLDDDMSIIVAPGGSAFQQAADNEDMERAALLGNVPSHELVEIDEETQEPLMARFVYVDEYTCIGK